MATVEVPVAVFVVVVVAVGMCFLAASVAVSDA